jgi:predicted nucleic acid-binding protein
MRSLYFDTAYLGKLRWPETGSAAVCRLAEGADELTCAAHGRAEFYSICHRKVREGEATAEQAGIVCAQFESDCANGGIRLLALEQAVLDRVAKAYRSAPPSLYLRAADALHLATAAQAGFREIFSNDRHLLAAAAHFGLAGTNVTAPA